VTETNDVIEAIRTARAIRRFSAEPVTDEELWTILEAAQSAPSGGNIQPWQFLVLTEPEAKAAVAAVYERAYDRYERALLASLPPFRSPDDEASFLRSVRASRYLAEHLTEAPAIVCVLRPAGLDLTLHDDEGPLDIGLPGGAEPARRRPLARHRRHPHYRRPGAARRPARRRRDP